MYKTIIIIFALSCITHTYSQEKFDNSLVKEKEQALQEKKDGRLLRGEVFFPPDAKKSITLKGILDEGLRNNPDERVRSFDREILEINRRDTYLDFWYPKVSLSLITEGNQRIDKIKTGNSGNLRPADTTPSGYFGLDFGDYAIFNWGKDYLTFLNKQTITKRNQRILDEARRELKHDLIIAYFELAYIKEREVILQEQLKQASFIYRLAREKIGVGKMPQTEYLLARTQYLKSRSDFLAASKESEIADENFSYLLGDKLATRYTIIDQLVYKKLTLTLDDALKLSLVNSPRILDSEVVLKNAQRDYELQLKENLPLPKFSIDLGTYTHSFSRNSNSTSFETLPGSKNIELVASINATWTLFGSGGFFNHRDTARSLISKQRAERLYFDHQRKTSSEVQKFHSRIKSLERELDIAQALESTARRSLNAHLDKYINGRVRYLNFSQSLQDLKLAALNFNMLKFDHLRQKIRMAQEIGVEEFPGEYFEDLGKTIGRKE